jgi:hypothetical protein
MNKKTGFLIPLFFTLLGLGHHALCFGQNGAESFPWASNQVMEPAELAAAIKSGDSVLILNTGPVDDIQGAVNIGPVEEKKNLRKLKKYLRVIPKDKEIVFYCGCCAMATCPNIKPAFYLLQKQGFTHFKILDIKETLAADWISKGYPMSKTPATNQ